MSVSEKKIAVVLAGCGVFDGSEIHEATCTLLNIAAQGASYQCFAPNIRQPMVVNHYTKAAEPDESRNVLTEAARIARGNIKSLAEFNPDQFDAVIFPGGQGAAKNLCDFAVKGAACDVNPDVEQALVIAYEKQMPIGAICIAPALVARVLGRHGITVTIGNDPKTAAEIEKPAPGTKTAKWKTSAWTMPTKSSPRRPICWRIQSPKLTKASANWWRKY